MTKKYHHQLQIFMKDVMKRNELTASLGNDELVFILISLKLSVFIGDILAANSSHSEFFNLSKQFWSITPEPFKEHVQSEVFGYNACNTSTKNKDIEDHWKGIWNLSVTKRIRVFVWMIYHNGIKTNQYLNHLNLPDNLCDYCDGKCSSVVAELW
ncbi:unnamed protein product [Vicia faba]|uniref:Reverse transcriptase zinc-binding domain-containing protein n=1 Tax=Vicia faba TaxID=3906 RepID=A0AAV1AA67_VICFA|nr:unnamed protein product [Vicia faba]